MTLKETFAELDSLKAEFQTFQPLKKDDEERLWEKFRLDWNFNSNHMEGNTLTYGHTKLLLIFDQTTGGYSLRENEEMKGHDVAIRMVDELAKDKERNLTEAFIRQLNKIILIRPFWKEAETEGGQKTRKEIIPGDYKEFPNSVRLENGEIFKYASPEETPAQMNDLMSFYNTHASSADTHPVWLAAMLHYKFVLIHPFDDGNGRVARLLTNYVLMKNGFPPLVIKSNEKKAYLTALNKADTGDLEAYVQYMAVQLNWSLQTSLKAAKGQNIDEDGDLDKKIAMLEKELAAIDVNETVQVKLGEVYFTNILDSWLSELLKKVIPEVQKFNRLFSEIQHYVAFINVGNSVNFADEPAIEVVDMLYDQFDNGRANISKYDGKIVFDARYLSLIKGGLKTFGCSYGFDIQFDSLKYEVLVDEFTENEQRSRKKIFEKLLHKPLTSEEIDQVVSLLTGAIFKHIDFHSKKKGLR